MPIQWRALTVKAVAIGKPEPEDEEVEGEHAVEIHPSGKDGIDAGRALDEFHTSVAVGCLDPFEFFVIDENGNEIVEDDDYKSYSYKG